jgi:hypothetical protein
VRRTWSAIPLALRVATLVSVGLALIMTIGVLARLSPGHQIQLTLFRSGTAFVERGFVLFGALELARQLAGRAASGAKLAALGVGVVLGLSVIRIGLELDQTWLERVSPYESWVWFAGLACVGIGLALAAWRTPVVAIAGALVWFAINRPPPLQEWYYRLVGAEPTTFMLVRSGEITLEAIVVLALAGVAVAALPAGFVVREPDRVRVGLGRIASALWLRVMATIAVPAATLLLVAGDSRHAQKILANTTLVAGLVSLASFMMLGFGALSVASARHPAVRRAPFLIAGACALWCGGLLMVQLPQLYRMMGDAPLYGYGGEDYLAKLATAFAVVAPLVAATSVIAMALGIAGFATRRESLELAGRGQRTAILVGLLQLASLGIATYMLPEVRSAGSFVLVTLTAVVLGLVAIVNAARLARDAASLVEPEPTSIPTATAL